MNKTTDEERALALAQAIRVMEMLADALPRVDPSTEEFEQACELYAKALILKLRLGGQT